MMLITNLKSDDKRLSVVVTKVYLMRWRIEEFYRFKKQQFKFEDLRVRSLKSIRNLDLFLTVAIGYLATMSEKHKDRMTAMQVIEVSKRIYRDLCSTHLLTVCLRYLQNASRASRIFCGKPLKRFNYACLKTKALGLLEKMGKLKKGIIVDILAKYCYIDSIK